MCTTYDEQFRRAKEAIRRGDYPPQEFMIALNAWVSASEAKALAASFIPYEPWRVPTIEERLVVLEKKMAKIRQDQ